MPSNGERSNVYTRKEKRKIWKFDCPIPRRLEFKYYIPRKK